MDNNKPCEICGSTQVSLHDGFYYCAECGTQDKTFQETIIEIMETGGEAVLGTKTKVHKIKEKEKELPDTWYRWHGFNFLLRGTADELLEHGAKPSFKNKLLWVWTRYLKVYLKNKEIGIDDEDRAPSPEPDNDEDEDSDVDLPQEDMLKINDKLRDRLVKKFSFSLLVALVYIGLNLDRSSITLTHLLKLFKDGILSVPYRINKLIPPEIKPEKLRKYIYRGLAQFKVNKIRIIAMTLFKRLDLGNPVVPDIRLLVDNYLKELCLPKDLKPLVLSLMHFNPSNLDVNAKDLLVYKMPYYELHVMTYILWALKLCLGLDGFYEVKLSSAVEEINKSQGRVKSHFVHGVSLPTDRLFSFREWITFYQFRQIMLRYYVHRLANKTTWDVDDYIALEHHMDLIEKDHEKNLRDEMTHDLINRIKGGEVETDLIPRSEFMHTVTPFHDYTQVIIQHLKDPEVILRLSEDFSSYSLKYATTDWNLVDPRSTTNRNLIKGIKTSNKHISNDSLVQTRVIFNRKKVYVRDCDNPNWLKTKPPTSEHVVRVDELDSDDEVLSEYVTRSSDKGVESEVINLTETKNDDVTLVKNQDVLDECFNKIAENKDGYESKSHSISEISVGNSSYSSRLQFEDCNDFVESKLNAAEKDMLKKLSNESNSKFPDFVSEHSLTNTTLSNSIVNAGESKVFESGKFDESEITKSKEMNKSDEIREETEDLNIFDDDFKLYIKEEVIEPNTEMDYENSFVCDAPDTVYDSFQDVPRKNSAGDNEDDSASQRSSLDSVNFNEKTFDRTKAIREIIMHICKKHKLPLPAEYNPRPRNTYRSRKEMGIFSIGADHTTQIFPKKVKRDYALERARRVFVKDVIDDYHNAARDDILNQLTQSVNTAIQNTLKENEASTLTQEPRQIPDQTLETTVVSSTVSAMDVDNISNHSDVNEEPLEVTELQKENENLRDEERLFSDESDGETHAKELLPEVNPDFDDEIYDANQLYLQAVNTVDDGEMELDPELPKIIDKKMAKDAKDPSLLTWTEERKKLERPDSEDEMPICVLQELQTLRKKLSHQEKTPLNPFLYKTVDKFKCWFKFLPLYHLAAYGRKFDKQLYNELPKSFAFVLKECSMVLGVKEGELYRNLQIVELSTIEKLNMPSLPKL